MILTCENSINRHVKRWIEMVENAEINACEDQKLLVKHVRKCFETQDIYTDDALLEKYLGLAKYFPYDRIFEWEEFCIALHLCTFWRENNRPRWPDLFLLIGRGAGKDGYIALESLCLTSPYSGLKEYDVDICANAEEQAMRPVNDILGVFAEPKYTKKMRTHFYWTKERIMGKRFRGIIRGRTNNPKSKDGMRSGMVVFNEIHQYANYANIKVFISGLGKKKHPRRLYATTNGEVREGPLDDMLKTSEEILKGNVPDDGFLPFICRLDEKDEAHKKECWVKANPSLIHLSELMLETEKEYKEWVINPIANADFMNKRMNLPQTNREIAVTEWENVLATNTPMIDLAGRACTAGIDYATTTDFASVNLHFKIGEMRYDINHSWLCLQSPGLHRLTVPWREWAEMGYITLVDEPIIAPELLINYIYAMGGIYDIRKIALDNYRYALLSEPLASIGFDMKERKNIKMVRPSDIMRTHPVIEVVFISRQFVWGDAPVLRWATNNTKLVRRGASAGSDTGNFFYGKVEAKSRKTDPFMALVASMVIEDELISGSSAYYDLPVITA